MKRKEEEKVRSGGGNAGEGAKEGVHRENHKHLCELSAGLLFRPTGAMGHSLLEGVFNPYPIQTVTEAVRWSGARRGSGGAGPSHCRADTSGTSRTICPVG